jgi:predicted transcriptional regulator
MECIVQDCPMADDRAEQPLPWPTRIMAYHRFAVSGGVLSIEGSSPLVVSGGQSSSALVRGSARLPLAVGTSCNVCDNEGTWLLKGNISISELRPQADSTIGATISGQVFVAQHDEVEVDPRVMGFEKTAVTMAATASAALILKFLLAPLFTRLTKEQALEHPRRKQIFDYIRDHPGANFREVARNTGIAAGTVRHHLNVLERSGQVVEHNHGSTVRLFENHGKFDQNWSDLVLLREPALGTLHDWLKGHPNSPQKAVLEAMEANGWSRSTTQHRLSRLVDGGVASIRLQGRLKLYTVVDKAVVPKPPGLPAPTRPLPA